VVTARVTGKLGLAPVVLSSLSQFPPTHRPLPILTHTPVPTGSPETDVTSPVRELLRGKPAGRSCREERDVAVAPLDAPWGRLDSPSLHPDLAVAQNPPTIAAGKPLIAPPFASSSRAYTDTGERHLPMRACAWAAWPRRPCNGLARLGPLFFLFFFFTSPTWKPLLGRPNTPPPAQPRIFPPDLIFEVSVNFC
jgi:hypothetical protein